jgi:hypothetical protein
MPRVTAVAYIFLYRPKPELANIHRTIGTFNRNKGSIQLLVNTLHYVIPFKCKNFYLTPER